MMFDKKDLLKLANLAKLELSPVEIDQYESQLSDILNYVGQLKHLNLLAIEASLSGVDADQLVLRPDQVKPSTPASLRQAAELADNYLVSPAVFKK